VPEEPAAPLKVTVPIEDVPPMTDVGLTDTLTKVAEVTVNGVVRVVPLSVALMAAVLVAFTGIVVTLKVAVVHPAITVIEVGTVAQLMFEDSVTTVPPVGAGPLMVTFPVDGAPPWTDVGNTVTLTRVGAVIVSVAL